jgi:MOB kinase activator 1
VSEGSKQYQLKRYATAVLGSGNLKQAVVLPDGEDRDEWLAIHSLDRFLFSIFYSNWVAVDFYNQINMLYSIVTEFCSPSSCPTMTAGPQYEYLWPNPTTKKPQSLPAPKYIENLLSQVQSQLDHPRLFPSEIGVPFPRDFLKTITVMWRRLSRVYGHLYCCHFSVICALGAEMHLNTSFKHFVLFSEEFEYVL